MGVPGEGPPPLWFGGDYNPEQWPEHVWAEDLRLMRRAGVTAATVGVFSWARLEPEEGHYTFDWLDRVLDLLHGAGIRAVLATPTASPPPWFSLAHPDALPVTEDGVCLTHGSRDTYCVCAPAYRAASERIAAKLATRYADHPALALWHVHNEYGTRCHCPHVAREFREWLSRRYGGLDALNDAWTTAFWSQHYSAWEQIQTPRATQYLRNPAQVLDFRRFLSDAMLAHYTAQRDILRAARPDIPVTTNLAFGGWVPVNPWQWAEHLDLVAIDDYPDRPGHAAAEQSAFAADLARSWAGGRPWLLMEQAPGAVHSGPRTLAKEPGELARHSLTHIARGSRGAMFFQWRASRGGAEQWHPAMVPHAGPDTRVFREVCDLGALLPDLAETAGSPVAADTALLWDPECWWALDGSSLPSRDLDYLETARQAHRVLWRLGHTVDFLPPEADPAGYPLVVVPALYLLSDSAAATLAGYVERGGNLVVTFLSGVADPNGRIRAGGYPGALRDLLGVWAEEFHPLTPESPVSLAAGDRVPGPEFGLGHVWSEHLHTRGAETVARYASGPLAGLPAITRHRHGSGRAWYLSTRLDDDGLAALLRTVPAVAGREPGEGPGLEIVRRVPRSGAQAWAFALNHGDTPERLTPQRVGLAPGTVDLLSGRPGDGLELAPGAVAVLRGRKPLYRGV